MIGTIIGGALGLGASLVGGIASAREARRAKEVLAQRAEDNQNWFDRRYNEDATQRADAQRLLSVTEDRIRNRHKQIAGTAAVMGSTEEGVAAAKATNAQALSDAVGSIAADGERRKDLIEGQYMAQKDALAGQQAQSHLQQAGAISGAASSLAQVGSNIADALEYTQTNHKR